MVLAVIPDSPKIQAQIRMVVWLITMATAETMEYRMNLWIPLVPRVGLRARWTNGARSVRAIRGARWARSYRQGRGCSAVARAAGGAGTVPGRAEPCCVITSIILLYPEVPMLYWVVLLRLVGWVVKV